MSGDCRLYSRALPGGGYVVIESLPASGEVSTVHARLLVERRADPTRRVGHVPPIVAETVAPDPQHAVEALSPIATNNVEIARALQRWTNRR